MSAIGLQFAMLRVAFMPETAAILFVLTVCAGIFVYAKLQALDPSKRNLAAELQQLRLQHAWLQEQLARAQREKWDQDMVARLADQLDAATRKLAKSPSNKNAVAAEVTRLD